MLMTALISWQGAKRLGRALEILGYPNSGRDAPSVMDASSSAGNSAIVDLLPAVQR